MARGIAVLILLALAACAPLQAPAPTESPSSEAAPAAPAPDEPKLRLKKVAFDQIAGWAGDRHEQAIPALLRSCEKITKLAPDLRLGGIGGVAGDWIEPCTAAALVPPDRTDLARLFFEAHFRPYLATADGRPEGLFTGYFEMQLQGSWLKTDRNGVPLYERPQELVDVSLGDFFDDLRGRRLAGKVVGGRLVPFDDRAAIEAGALSGRGLELMWVNDPIDAFFLHVQGSGRVRMDDGSIVRIGYAAKNGHTYTSIGKELVKRGELPLERVSMQSIRTWMIDHPDQARDLMAKNRSFIFFRVVEGALKSLAVDQGPIGAQGLPLTPGRSLAVDRRYIPLGLPIWLDTTDPLEPGEPLRRLVIAQDTGSAIRGPVRGDVFWGFGKEAALRAGLMKQPGRYFLLLPRTDK